MPKYDLKEMREKQIVRDFYEQEKQKAKNIWEYIQALLRCDVIDISTADAIASAWENVILKFRHTFLSNFYPVNIRFQWISYPSVEHAYLRQKFDLDVLDKKVSVQQKQEINDILKSRGHSIEIKSFKQVFDNPSFTSWNVKVITRYLVDLGFEREDRDDVKLLLMIQLVRQKFTQHQDMKTKLLNTKDTYLVEGNTWWDVYWWRSEWRGNNYLWRLLMIIRGIISWTIEIPDHINPSS